MCFDHDGRVLLIARKYPPFQGVYGLPGGFVEAGETVEHACRRELKEETGLEAGNLALVGVFSTPGRDPRGPTVTVAYLTQIEGVPPRPATDAASAPSVSDWRALDLVFDHAEILKSANLLLSTKAA